MVVEQTPVDDGDTLYSTFNCTEYSVLYSVMRHLFRPCLSEALSKLSNPGRKCKGLLCRLAEWACMAGISAPPSADVAFFANLLFQVAGIVSSRTCSATATVVEKVVRGKPNPGGRVVMA
jgi:hypothetical protein